MHQRLIYIVISFLFFHISVNAQVSDTTLFSPEELEEDADYFFEFLNERHPDPYYYCGMEEFELKKSLLYKQFDHPMTKMQFIEAMSTMNSCLDSHTNSNFDLLGLYMSREVERLQNGEQLMIIPLFLKIKDGYLYTPSIDSSDVKLLFINKVDTREIVNKLKSLMENQSVSFINYAVATIAPALLKPLFDIEPPYMVEYMKDGKKENKKLENISLPKPTEKEEGEGEGEGEKAKEEKQSPIYYKVYPQSSTAILYLRTFEETIAKAENLEAKMKMFSDSLRLHKIKNLFIDVSKNGGGQYTTTYQIFDYLKHDTVFVKCSKVDKLSEGGNEYTPYSKEVIRLPRSDKTFHYENLFVLQGTVTYSCGDLFCRIIAQNNLGTLIGSSTSTFTKDFGNIWGNEPPVLPNTKIEIRCPSSFWDFSADFDTETLEPDMYWQTDYKMEFSEEELVDMIKQVKEMGK